MVLEGFLGGARAVPPLANVWIGVTTPTKAQQELPCSGPIDRQNHQSCGWNVGAGGTVEFPRGYVKRAFELVRQYGGICISDEVQTGFGRTGEHFWGYEMHGVQPDMVIMAKGIANGFPMAALVIEEEELQKNSHKVGTYFLQKLGSLRDRIEIMGDVRGKGLMIGIELVDNKDTRKPLDAARMAAIVEKTKDNGILVGKGGIYGTALRIKPPMCIKENDVASAIDALEKSFKNV
uniref:Alanine--glyoxylate aminotransferase 2, mitochondrial n=1 Tax=Romanomermis culicivorax TaxID=13658 RepID=A0A915HVQ5_ROMCU